MLNMIRVRILEYKPLIPVFVSMTVMAIALIYVFGLGFSQDFKPAVAIVDEDMTQETLNIRRELGQEDGFEMNLYNYEEAVRLLENGKVIAVIYFDPGYTKGVLQGSKGVTFIKSTEALEHQALEMALQSAINRTFGNEAFLDSIEPIYDRMNLSLNREDMAYNINDIYRNRPMITVNTRAYQGQGALFYDSLKQSFMGFILFFSLFTMVFGIGTIVDNKQTRVWHRQIVSPITGSQILGSSLIVGFAAGIIQILTMVITAKYIFDIDLGDSLLALMLVFSAYIIAALCLGLFISSFVKTEQQLSAFTPMIVVSTSMLGGCMWPLELVTNQFIKGLSLVTPQRWAMEGLQAVIIYNGDISNVIQPVTYSLILASVFFGLSMISYRRVNG